MNTLALYRPMMTLYRVTTINNQPYREHSVKNLIESIIMNFKNVVKLFIFVYTEDSQEEL